MVRRIAIRAAWAVLGLSALAWAGSYFGTPRVPLPQGGGLVLPDGGVYSGRLITTPVTATRMIVPGGLILPLWLPVMAAGFTLWLLWRVGFERRQLALVGHCSDCGYDLTGSSARSCGPTSSPSGVWVRVAARRSNPRLTASQLAKRSSRSVVGGICELASGSGSASSTLFSPAGLSEGVVLCGNSR